MTTPIQVLQLLVIKIDTGIKSVINAITLAQPDTHMRLSLSQSSANIPIYFGSMSPATFVYASSGSAPGWDSRPREKILLHGQGILRIRHDNQTLGGNNDVGMVLL